MTTDAGTVGISMSDEHFLKLGINIYDVRGRWEWNRGVINAQHLKRALHAHCGNRLTVITDNDMRYIIGVFNHSSLKWEQKC